MAPRLGHQDRRGYDSYMYAALAMMPLSLGLMVLYSWMIGLAAFLFTGVVFIVLEAVSAPPFNGPRKFVKGFLPHQTKSRPIMVCLGDSLTHGTCSSSFTPDIPRKLAEKLGMDPPDVEKIFADPLWVVNAGQNGIGSHNILKERVNGCMNCYPDYVLILIGTNDVRAMYKPSWAKTMVSTWKLPEAPNLKNYEHNLRGIIDFIQEDSINTQIGVCTLPPMGENLEAPANDWVRKANVVIEKTVNSYDQKVSLVPLYEQFESILEKKPNKQKSLSVDYFLPIATAMCGIFYLLPGFFTWNTMSKPFGNLLLSDGLHLNERGKDVLVETVLEWLMNSNIAKTIAVKSR
mmetsp:Transcript_1794/g.4243  ORF Transcript_1794/g.4243 Transcript_1794/m.4243 type:complete len:347 (+) Transcript_1794:69-1109(+)